ncbi:heavy metal translocating P-type ATPase [Sporomusa sp.]|uniref:heavy metal translocating P-type ATPase n=1 Tax=Sporomusa sp. TaxID=2078658 RepID=UPI002CEE27F5|nr:heavy metal translocating P-type ATPase [Sporomusa sp.]HWR41911.1 heavy metal translocating P-type ATPase [Sporomusa sp.]
MPAVIATSEYRLIPGRLRISITELRQDPKYAQNLAKHLLGEKAIRSVTANPLTGRALIYFDHALLGVAEIQRLISAASQAYFTLESTPQTLKNTIVNTTHAQNKTHTMYTLATGGVLAALILKRLIAGKSPLSSSTRVFNLAALTTIIAGYPILYNGFETLAKKKRINHDLVLFLATLVLLAMRESITGLSVLWLVHLTNLFRLTMQVRNTGYINHLLTDKQQKVWRWENRRKNLVKYSDLQEGNIVLIHPGESIPVDGQVVAGKACVTQAAMSGDYQPQLKIVGDMVYAGTQVQAGSLKVNADKVGNATSMAQIACLVTEAQVKATKSLPPNRYADTLMWWAIAISGTVFWLTRDVMRSLAVLLTGCPAAIALSRNAALGAAVSTAAEQGIFVKEIEAIERVGQVDTVLFDKTGTLTTALPQITEIISLTPDYNENEVLVLAASAEKSTSHPLARMLLSEAQKRDLALIPANSRSLFGYGVQAIIGEKTIVIGNRLLMERKKVPFFRAKATVMRLEHLGNSILYVAVNRRLVGLIGVSDMIKPESYTAIRQLRSLGIKAISVITGDSPYAAEHISTELGLTEEWHSMLPEAKMHAIEEIRQTGKQIAMVGDGTNDSPAFAASNVGIAMGMSGTAQAIHAADIVIANDDPRKVPQAVRLGRHTNEVIKQNLALSVGSNIVGMALAAARLISPVTAGLLLNVSTLAVIFNSGRLLSRRRRREQVQMDLQRFSQKNSMAKACSASKSNVVCFPGNNNSYNNSADTQNSWHAQASTSVCDMLETSSQFGLTDHEAQLRIGQYGKNALQESEKPSFWKLLSAQFKDFMVQVLLGAAGLAFAIGKTRDAMLTVGIVIANAFLGVIQERKASSSLESLKTLSAPQARVTRGGRTFKVFAENLVPGDIIVLEAGDRVPADVRLLSCSHLEVEESALTGEPLPVRKEANTLCPQEYQLADRRNMAFMGTSVTRGRATAVVIATGMATEMGKIASLIQSHNEETTPLQRRLEELGKYLVYGCLGVSGLVFLIGLLRGQTTLTMLQTAASLAVAAIPEGLTAIVIIALAMGVQRMSKRNIIIRKLSSIETLGCATAICSDKTGTLTQNKMTVREIYTLDRTWRITGEGYMPCGCFQLDKTAIVPSSNIELMATLRSGILCNNARLVADSSPTGNVIAINKTRQTTWAIDGDPTEGALVVVAAKAGLKQTQLESTYRRLKELPFEAERRMMSVVCQEKQALPTLYCKGAADKILSICTHYVKDGQTLPLDAISREKIEQANLHMTGKAMRVLACAYRDLPHFQDEEQANDLEEQLVFCGLVGMIDPPRLEVPKAITKCKAAGVKVIMITGDHPLTAKAIACELGLMGSTERVVAGNELDIMSDAELAKIVADISVYARTSPQQKLRIVKALKSNGFVVAMTGDGVNDAPAVKCADIGIAMGIMGTDVTKQAASMTLADDNFATIIRAMEEGRSIYTNIRKAIRYLVATNIGEVVLMLLAAVIGLPLPLIPLQLLWLNLIGDGLPAIALVNDPPAKNIMTQSPKTADESVFSGGLGRKVVSRGIIIGVTSLALFAWKLINTGNLTLARTIVIAQLALSQFIHLFDCRIEREAGQVGIFSNPWLIGAFSLSLAMVVGIIHLPWLQPIFSTVALTGSEWLIAALLAGLTSIADFGIEGIIERSGKKNRFIPIADTKIQEVV